MWHEVFADENEMRQMLYNLLTNSMRAVSRDGTGKIRLSGVFRRRYDYILRLRQWKRE